jgi:hypothetical protein
MALLFATLANAQTKPKPGAKPGKPLTKQEIVRRDSLKKDSLAKAKIEEAPVKLPHEFMVYSKKPKVKGDRTKLCFNLIHNDLALNYCMNDSLCVDPEVSKVMFEQRNGDTLYVLVFVEAYTKIEGFDDGRCSAGRETKLVFARWNTKTNQAKWKQKNISSCRKGITNMTKEPILDWDKTSPLVVNYNRGLNFYEIKFDPNQYQLGFQSNNNSESESK